jgi:2-polyprenyl-3-methyl-5-hydroxy-6-metoxy-1,4-benzoquinol methylase
MERNQHIFMPLDHMDELYNSKNGLVKFVHNNRLDNIATIISKLRVKGKRVLDAGCGEGHLLEKLQNVREDNEYWGIDITPIAIEQAKKRCPFANIGLGDLFKTGYPEESFDVIICTEVLEHITDFKGVLEEFKRILKPGGILIITFPNEILWTISRFFLGRRPIKVPDHVNSFSPRNIKRYVNMRPISAKGLPFRLPFFASLGCSMIFKKDN